MGQSPIPKIRLEKRAGKTVTTVSGLHTYGVIEIQGDKVAEAKTWFVNHA